MGNERLEDLCYQNRMELLDSGVEEYKVDVICFRTEFMRALLTKGYHFNPTTDKQIKFVNSPDGNDFGWTLGNMIITSNDMPDLWPKVYIRKFQNHLYSWIANYTVDSSTDETS